MRLVEQPSDEFELHFDEVFAIYAKYQTVVHNDSPSDLTPDRFRRFLAASPLTREELGAEQSPRLGSYHQVYNV
jgi:arginyl-tRNA--protein-N-Asp/Glu arginylyltransferase